MFGLFKKHINQKGMKMEKWEELYKSAISGTKKDRQLTMALKALGTLGIALKDKGAILTALKAGKFATLKGCGKKTVTWLCKYVTGGDENA